MDIRPTIAYRIVSTAALQVIADLQVKERFRARNRESERRAQILDLWQETWSEDEVDSWTRKIIPDLCPWVQRKHGCVSYLTQVLTGHGCFRAYLLRFKSARDNRCVYCGQRKWQTRSKKE
ncbi:uncharacterized protein LOC108916145 [Anoplophora glabripennis]|uniref:uncharacterized protein LOC108916145 n=1 Tax=Anoplophora glabripennis TaxID=217634 RepID=UPI000874D38E|nr:uncharacterized protein LOC108916145 [Anoplophora glabripennis]